MGKRDAAAVSGPALGLVGWLAVDARAAIHYLYVWGFLPATSWDEKCQMLGILLPGYHQALSWGLHPSSALLLKDNLASNEAAVVREGREGGTACGCSTSCAVPGVRAGVKVLPPPQLCPKLQSVCFVPKNSMGATKNWASSSLFLYVCIKSRNLCICLFVYTIKNRDSQVSKLILVDNKGGQAKYFTKLKPAAWTKLYRRKCKIASSERNQNTKFYLKLKGPIKVQSC